MSEQLTFFDVDNEPIKMVFRSKYRKWKYEHNYRKADNYSDIRCKNCRYLFANNPKCTGGGRYYKCELLGFSSSEATDVRLSNVCNLFEMYVKEQPRTTSPIEMLLT